MLKTLHRPCFALALMLVACGTAAGPTSTDVGSDGGDDTGALGDASRADASAATDASPPQPADAGMALDPWPMRGGNLGQTNTLPIQTAFAGVVADQIVPLPIGTYVADAVEPVLCRGMWFVPTQFLSGDAGLTPGLLALSTNGSVAWQVPRADIAAVACTGDGPAYLTSSDLVALDRSGQERWRVPAKNASGRLMVRADGSYLFQVGGELVLVAGSGSVLHRTVLPSGTAGFVGVGSDLIATTSSGLIVVNPATGSVRPVQVSIPSGRRVDARLSALPDGTVWLAYISATDHLTTTVIKLTNGGASEAFRVVVTESYLPTFDRAFAFRGGYCVQQRDPNSAQHYRQTTCLDGAGKPLYNGSDGHDAQSGDNEGTLFSAANGNAEAFTLTTGARRVASNLTTSDSSGFVAPVDERRVLVVYRDSIHIVQTR